MACSCKGRRSAKFVWTSEDGTQTLTYPTEIQAKAKKMREGGSYKQQG